MPIGAEPISFAGLFDDLDNLRTVWQAVEIGMDLQSHPLNGGRRQSDRRASGPDCENRVRHDPETHAVNGIELAIAQVAKIDPADLADCAGEWRNLEGHFCEPLSNLASTLRRPSSGRRSPRRSVPASRLGQLCYAPRATALALLTVISLTCARAMRAFLLSCVGWSIHLENPAFLEAGILAELHRVVDGAAGNAGGHDGLHGFGFRARHRPWFQHGVDLVLALKPVAGGLILLVADQLGQADDFFEQPVPLPVVRSVDVNIDVVVRSAWFTDVPPTGSFSARHDAFARASACGQGFPGLHGVRERKPGLL